MSDPVRHQAGPGAFVVEWPDGPHGRCLQAWREIDGRPRHVGRNVLVLGEAEFEDQLEGAKAYARSAGISGTYGA